MSKYCLNHLLMKLIMAPPIYCDESLRMRTSHLLRFLSHMRRKTPLLKPEAVDLEGIKWWETPCWPGTQQCLPQKNRNATTHHGFTRDASATNKSSTLTWILCEHDVFQFTDKLCNNKKKHEQDAFCILKKVYMLNWEWKTYWKVNV